MNNDKRRKNDMQGEPFDEKIQNLLKALAFCIQESEYCGIDPKRIDVWKIVQNVRDEDIKIDFY
jgi:hypothetical protein